MTVGACGRFPSLTLGIWFGGPPPSPHHEEELPVSQVPHAADLAMVGDVVPSGFANVSGEPIGGNSLDNTLRLHAVVPTRWVLCDIQMDAAGRGFAHGHLRLFAEDGTLMATASQSLVLRYRKGG